MKVWIDLANSPHPLLFAPIAKRLEHHGHDVLVTARDNAQTAELARRLFADPILIGGSSPRARTAKAAALAKRVEQLIRWAHSNRPDVALSHNSYAQIIAGRALRMPVVTAMDFEFQPANHIAFRLANTVLVPDVLPLDAVKAQGASPSKVRTYAGLKEEVYLGDFNFDPHVLQDVGFRNGNGPVVVLRTPPNRAVYHRLDNPLFEEVLRALGSQVRLRTVVLPRHFEQARAIAALGVPNCFVPTSAVDSRSLMYSADLVIGAGGTMTREAALLGVPTFTVYAGRAPAVDQVLESRGLLTRLARAGDLGEIRSRTRDPETLEDLRDRGEGIIQVFVDEVERAGAGAPRSRR